MQRPQLYSSQPDRAQYGPGGNKVVKVGVGQLKIDDHDDVFDDDVLQVLSMRLGGRKYERRGCERKL